MCQVCAELRFLLSQAQLKKEDAEREVRDISSKLGRQLELVEQVREKNFNQKFCNSQCYWYKWVFTLYVQKNKTAIFKSFGER